MRNYRELKVWEKAHHLTLKIYQVTSSFPKEEMYGMTSQIRRASSSIPANIAEGGGRDSDAQFINFLQIASGSASELDYHLLLAHDLKFINDSDYTALANDLIEIRKMLTSFIRRFRPAPNS